MGSGRMGGRGSDKACGAIGRMAGDGGPGSGQKGHHSGGFRHSGEGHEGESDEDRESRENQESMMVGERPKLKREPRRYARFGYK